MLSRREIELALIGWRAATDVADKNPDLYTEFERGRNHGYVLALEVVLRAPGP